MNQRSEHSPMWREGGSGPATLRYLVAGQGSPVVLLHGLSGSARWWQHNIRSLASSFQVHVPELMRFGGAHPRPRFALEDSSGMIAAWMRSIGLARAAFVGHSMGGIAAASLAADYPDIVDKLVLVDAAIFPPGGARLRLRHLIQRLPNFPPDLMPVLISDAWWATPIELWRASRAIFKMNLAPKLRAIARPTLIIWGAEDGLLPVPIAHYLRDSISASELKVFEGVGHCPMWEAPELFNSLVRSFLLR